MTGDWRNYTISADLSHHISGGFPAYPPAFAKSSNFTSPAWRPYWTPPEPAHHPRWLPAYSRRYLRAFGFYEGRAAVQASEGWFHILADGRPLYGERYAWCGNFQEGRCPVRDSSGNYFHLNAEGGAAYRRRYRYAGDFRDGYAVVQREDGRHTHVDAMGRPSTASGSWTWTYFTRTLQGRGMSGAGTTWTRRGASCTAAGSGTWNPSTTARPGPKNRTAR